MASGNTSTEYLYSSARIRSMENTMIGKECLERLLDMKTSADVQNAIVEYGFVPVRDEDGMVNREETFLSVLKNAYNTVLGMVPDRDVFRFLLFRYDCNNVKAAIKAFIRGISPEGMLFDFGTVAAGDVAGMPATGNFSALPPHMAASAKQATEEFAKTRNPQVIDLCLDRACFADMLDSATASGIPLAVKLVRAETDLVNFMITIRILRMENGRAGRALLEDALLPGGAYAVSDLLRLYEAGEKRLLDAIAYSDYSMFASAVSATDGGLAGIECAADNVRMEIAKSAKLIPYGPEVAIGYLFGMEYAVKNVRIIFAGKDAGLSSDVIRERVRASYV